LLFGEKTSTRVLLVIELVSLSVPGFARSLTGEYNYIIDQKKINISFPVSLSY
jgi:hypothetical protein